MPRRGRRCCVCRLDLVAVAAVKLRAMRACPFRWSRRGPGREGVCWTSLHVTRQPLRLLVWAGDRSLCVGATFGARLNEKNRRRMRGAMKTTVNQSTCNSKDSSRYTCPMQTVISNGHTVDVWLSVSQTPTTCHVISSTIGTALHRDVLLLPSRHGSVRRLTSEPVDWLKREEQTLKY